MLVIGFEEGTAEQGVDVEMNRWYHCVEQTRAITPMCFWLRFVRLDSL